MTSNQRFGFLANFKGLTFHVRENNGQCGLDGHHDKGGELGKVNYRLICAEHANEAYFGARLRICRESNRCSYKSVNIFI